MPGGPRGDQNDLSIGPSHPPPIETEGSSLIPHRRAYLDSRVAKLKKRRKKRHVGSRAFRKDKPGNEPSSRGIGVGVGRTRVLCTPSAAVAFVRRVEGTV